MATTAALSPSGPRNPSGPSNRTTSKSSSGSNNMDIDEHDDLPTTSASTTEDLLAERLSNACLNDNDGDDDNDIDHIHNRPSEESTLEDDDLPTPEGFFIDSKPSSHHQSSSRNPLQTIPQSATNPLPWPSTPPPKSTMVHLNNEHHTHRAVSSCPRPHSHHHHRTASVKQSTHSRPLFVSSSSGALIPPTIERASSSFEDENNRNTIEDDDDIDMDCPASRAAAAIQALETTNDHLVLSELHNQNQLNQNNLFNRQGSQLERVKEHPSSHGSHASSMDISRQETFHTSHNSSLNDLGDKQTREPPPLSRTFDAYPSGPNEPIPQHFTAEEDDVIPPLYTFTPKTLSGKLLTYLSRKFVPRQKQHTHGGSALAGFLALLLVTCANYMLGPMRDAAALAVGVSHIPALTLASTVLALGSSVPVGWLFEAPDPRRRRVWKRMGLTRGETQGTSLALFYRVFAFLLLSYALGFKIVDKFGKRNGNNGDSSDGVNGEGGQEESAITLVSSFFLRLAASMGIPVPKILANMEQFVLSVLGMQQFAYVSSTSVQATLQLYANESIPALFVHAFKSVVNKFGKVIYIMFFLVVHLMKLHSLSLIWGVTTEAMEYEETAELRRAAKEKEGVARVSSAGGLVLMGNGSPTKNQYGGSSGSSSGDDNNQASSSNNGVSSSKPPSKSSLRLKRLGFVGFGGTLGGILGSVIASFAAHILHLSGLLIVAAILLELSANLSIELGRIMQRHWEEQMKYQSCGDLTALASAENLAGQQENTTVDTSMRKSVSLGSMKRVASGSLSSGNLANLAAMQQANGRRSSLPGNGKDDSNNMTRARSIASISLSSEDKAKGGLTDSKQQDQQQQVDQPMIDDNSFKQRLLRGITTILRSRLLMSIFTYNALYASTSVLLSFQRAELVANRGTSNGSSSAVSNTAFLAKINTASSVAVFALQASGLGAYIANGCGQRGALALMPIIRLTGVILLGWWHLMSDGQPPDLILFLVIDEFTKVINFAIAKPVRENLWRGLSAEARYEAKPIVDTLANRWGGGSAAFLVSFLNRIVDLTGLGVVNEKNGERSIFGFPPVLLLCMIISTWWTAVSADVGNIRRKIDLELKKQQ